jgi:large subunit ribosomal protein L15
MVELNSSRCLHGVKDGVKLLARGKEELTTPINIIVSRASAEAIEAVEKLGGTVTTRFYSPFAIRKVLGRKMHPFHSLQSRIQMAPAGPEGAEAVAEAMVVDRKKYPFRLPDPTSRKDLEYYRDSAHRGYLSHMVEEGHGPSLFFKTPGAGRVDRRKVTSKGGKSLTKSENRVW